MLTAKLDKVPPATVKSAAVNAVTGVSEAVKVIVAMLPLAMEAVGVVMAMVGAKVSMLMLGVVPVPPVLVPTSA